MTPSDSASSLGAASPEHETPQHDVHELVRRAQRRDPDASRELVRRYYDGVCGLAYRFLSNAHDAQDIAQEAFLRVFGALDRFDLDLSFKPWLNKITMNLIMDALRARYRATSTSLDAGPSVADPGADPADKPAADEEHARVRQIVDSLPPKYRTVLVLRDLEDYSMGEIASMLECPQATVRWRLHRARQMFKRKWERTQSS